MGIVTDDSIDSITFNDDGTLRVTSDAEITIQFEGIAAPQTIKLSVSDPDSTDRLTHNAADSDLQVDPDGSAPGVINDIQVDTDGRIVGSASNGEIFTIAQLAIANFKNEKGLFSVADNLYGQSLNSGLPEVGIAASSGRGKVESGKLEMSNVDIAFEFTRLIVAQRGFSANARTITESDEMLEELTNIIR
jgi:flagellar hook protein FlgE